MLEKLGLGAILSFNADPAIAAMGRAGAAAKYMRQGFQRIGTGLSTMAGGVGKVAASMRTAVLGVVAVMGASVASSATFEASLAKIGTLLDNGTREARQYSGAIQDLAIKYGQATKQVGEGVYQAISASVAPDEVVAFLDVATQAAAAAYSDTATSVDALTTVMNAYTGQLGQYGDAAGQATRLSDMLFLAQKRGKTTFGEIAGSIGMVASTAALAKIPFEEVTSGIAAMTKAGINTNMSVVALNQAILGFVKPSKQALGIAKKYGIELSGTALRSKGLAAALSEVEEKLGGNEDALASIFGNVRAYRAAAVLAGTASEDFKNILAETQQVTGITAEKFDDVSRTLSFQFKRSLEAGKVALTRIGDAAVQEFGLTGNGADWLVKRMDGLVLGFRKFFRYVREGFDMLAPVWQQVKDAMAGVANQMERVFGAANTDKAKKLTAAALALGVAIVPIGAVLGPVTGAMGGLIAIVKGAATAISGLLPIVKGIAIALGGPWAVAIGAVAALLGGAFVTNAGGAMDALKKLWVPFKDVLGTVKDVALSIWDKLKPAFEDAMEIVGELFSALEPLISLLLDSLKPAFKAIGWAIETFVIEPVRLVLKVIKKMIDAIKWAIDQAKQLDPRNVKAPAPSWTPDYAAWKKREAAAKAAQAIGPPAPTVSDKAGAALRSAGDTARGVGQAFAQAVAKESMAERARTAIADGKGEDVRAKGKASERAAKCQKLRIDNKLSVDGREVAAAGGRAELELRERAGSDVSPWQRRMIVERGAVRVEA